MARIGNTDIQMDGVRLYRSTLDGMFRPFYCAKSQRILV